MNYKMNEREENYRQWDGADKFDVDHFMPKNAISTEYWKDHLKESNWDLFFTNDDDEEVLDQNKYKKGPKTKIYERAGPSCKKTALYKCIHTCLKQPTTQYIQGFPPI